MTKEEMMKRNHVLRVGDLKAFIERYEFSDDALIVVQRIEDRYYEGNDISGMRGQREDGTYGILPPGSKASGWKVYCKPGDMYHTMTRFNEKLTSGVFEDKEQYPNFKPENCRLFTEEEMEDAKEQYSTIHCPVKYEDENDVIFLNLHY